MPAGCASILVLTLRHPVFQVHPQAFHTANTLDAEMPREVRITWRHNHLPINISNAYWAPSCNPTHYWESMVGVNCIVGSDSSSNRGHSFLGNTITKYQFELDTHQGGC